MLSNSQFCVCVLLYGTDDYCFRMAQRVINTPLRGLGAAGIDFRFGLNAVSEQTRTFVHQAVHDSFPGALVVDCPENIHKYPMMRRLLYDRTLTSSYLMWFDDDSCIIPSTDLNAWLSRIQRQMHAYAMLGSVHKTRYIGNQPDWIKAQAWYNSKEPQQYVQFAAGGWWTIRADVLTRFDWPPPQFKHRGGDVMLGELLRQHDLPLGHFRDNLWINANEFGVESQSTRRGRAESPIGYDYVARG
jgi:hypothetical protein